MKDPIIVFNELVNKKIDQYNEFRTEYYKNETDDRPLDAFIFHELVRIDLLLKATPQEPEINQKDVSIFEVGFSNRAYNVIQNACNSEWSWQNYITKPYSDLKLSDLAKVSFIQWLRVKGCGITTAGEIRNILLKYEIKKPPTQ